jgi:hypothetical protein
MNAAINVQALSHERFSGYFQDGGVTVIRQQSKRSQGVNMSPSERGGNQRKS